MKSQAEYIKTPNTCPNCGSHNIEGQSVEIIDDTAIQEVVCLDCEAVWEDIYKLTGYELTECPS